VGGDFYRRSRYVASSPSGLGEATYSAQNNSSGFGAAEPPTLVPATIIVDGMSRE
jgi:hypothetical protein